MGLNTSVLGMEVRSSAFSWLSFLECIQSAVTLTMSCERWVSWSAGGWAPLASGAGASMQLHTLHSYCLLTCNNHTESVEEWRKGDKHSPSQASRIHGLKYFKLKQKFLAKFWHKTVLDKIVWRGWRWSSLKYFARRLTMTRPGWTDKKQNLHNFENLRCVGWQEEGEVQLCNEHWETVEWDSQTGER